MSVKTINPKDNRSVEITFNLVATNSQETSLQIYDMKLGPIQISSFYGSYLRDVNNGSKTITDVLEAWAADNQPCPANLEDYFKYFIEP